MADEFRMPKRVVPLDVALADGSSRQVSVFLSPGVPEHAGEERLVDLLNRAEPFFPAEERDGGGFLHLGRRAIRYVRASEDAVPPAEPADDRSVEVVVTLLDGERLQGAVHYSAPPERARLTDHLNGPEVFFVLHDGAGHVYLVNKRQVASVIEVT